MNDTVIYIPNVKEQYSRSDLDFLHYVQFIIFKVSANLRAEAARYFLSYLWWIFEPILHMLVYYIIFGVLLQRGTENYLVFLLTGIIPMLWFNKTVMNSMVSILGSKALIHQVYLPKIVLPAIFIFENAFKQMIVMGLLLIFLIIRGQSPTIHWTALPIVFMSQLIVNSAFSYIAAAVLPFVQDLKFLINSGLQMIFFLSGVFFSVDMIPEKYHTFFFLNPLAVLLDNYRKMLLHGEWIEWQSILHISTGSILVVLLTMLVINKLDHVYPRIIL